ncbi:hypothetical protein [Vibrio cyclitrophicus]|uniref:hypothetical protein n=1 Tax=Vibrio cyclitrophicus TaxID=47951 RepID=UPI0009BE3083|nr:hypothetical protein [Vibrio cyclitrophicus]
MGKKEFGFSVLASIVAAIILEASGAVEVLKYITLPFTIPLWGIVSLVLLPITLSIFWFRVTKTPKHEEALKNLKELESRCVQLESNLTQSKSHSATIESLVNEIKREKLSLENELAEWKQNGIMLHPIGAELEQVVDKVFGPEIVELDGKHFIGCKFNGTILKFRGTGPMSFSHDKFNDVRWVMDNPATNAIDMLRGMYASGMPEMRALVEQTFENIRKNEDFT